MTSRFFKCFACLRLVVNFMDNEIVPRLVQFLSETSHLQLCEQCNGLKT